MNTLESVTIGDYYQPQPKQLGDLGDRLVFA
jgi:hypothetical protein